jgi:4-aminobutyrate aminotransferase/(S)-3-amino-2-methylpropionate transaminase
MTSRETLNLLRDYESRNITFMEDDGSWPIVWERASGTHVWDAEGKRYLDLTAAFGVAATGHANPRVIAAGCRQLRRLPHAMGDVHPHALKALLARELSRITFERWRFDRGLKSNGPAAKTIFCNSGFEAVEAGLKTAMLATGKPQVIAFTRGYHGLGYGALNATHRKHFRRAFTKQMGNFARFLSFPPPDGLKAFSKELTQALHSRQIGAIIVEPVQVRGGVHLAIPGFLQLLRKASADNGALLILDEIYTGFGRTGKWFACEYSKVIPDIICLGKALTGGFPLSACVGSAEVMDAAWPRSSGEAIHTSTFLGNPVGCAMALAQIRELKSKKLIQQSAVHGRLLLEGLHGIARKIPGAEVRGIGLVCGLELRKPDGSPATARALKVIKEMLRLGFILLPEGEHSNVISFSPPLTISKAELRSCLVQLERLLVEPLSATKEGSR